MNAHELTPEQLAIAAEGDENARSRHYIKLGIAVIMQAIEDATRTIPDTPASASRHTARAYHVQRSDRRDARKFLLTENDDLEFWCHMAGVSMPTILYYARHAQDRWNELGVALRANHLNLRKAS